MTGFICLDKPDGMTSFSALKKMRYILGEKKIGHTGTLDPMATGVLTVALGGATRFIEMIPDHDKSYFAVIKFGVLTDTLDITGNVIKEEKSSLTLEEIENVLKNFVGDITQIPPMYSAIKKDGVRLYDLARQGIEIERQQRPVRIDKIEIVEFNEDLQELSVNVDCSSGTYIRSLARDIGESLSTCATLKKLVRTKANGFEKCYSLEQIEEYFKSGNISEILIPTQKVFVDYPAVTVTGPQSIRFSNGGELSLDRLRTSLDDGFVRVYSPENVFLGIGQAKNEKNELKAKRIFNER
ncbi:MAG: tRNA pseudouridine(55) synthase TruB [Clostridia bacterium]|nr:tRNA pseudouridine(55) synthase TruB [Clostridia bacterium]